MGKELSCRLPTGLIELDVEQEKVSAEELIGFGARRNPKRGFLFVSKVLGRHIPVRPGVCLAMQKALALEAAAHCRGRVLVAGLAETAAGLGQGVFEALWEAAGEAERAGMRYASSTRHPEGLSPAFEFAEGHSHASRHWICAPEAGMDYDTILVVDDEQSTGATALGLAAGLKATMAPSATRAVIASFCDWIDPAARCALREKFAQEGLQAEFASLCRGSWKWTPEGPCEPLPPELPRALPAPALSPWAGRMGASVPARMSPAWPKALGLAERIGMLADSAGLPVSIVGTGEWAHWPLLVAKALEDQGRDVLFQCVSRSPALPFGAIGSSLETDPPAGGSARHWCHNPPGPKRLAVALLETEEAARLWRAPAGWAKAGF